MAAVVVLAAGPVVGQRVQFPSMASQGNAYAGSAPAAVAGPTTTLQPPKPLWDPYAQAAGQPAAAPPYMSPPYTPAPYTPPAGAPPAGGVAAPYTASPYAAPPTGSPYTAAPYATPPYGASPYAAGPYDPGVYPPPGSPPASEFFSQPTRFLQLIEFDNTWLAGGGAQGLGVNDDELSATFAIPLFAAWSPFLVTPGFAFHFWDGPNSANFAGMPDMPPRTYDAYLDTAWKPQFSPRLGADLAVRVGVYSDFNSVNFRSLRLPSRALGVFTASPQWQFAAGIVYLDRLSVRLLPAGGVIWTPNADTRYEILFPRPKLSQRITTIRNTDIWGYVAGEYGGNTWTIDRVVVGPDVVDYADLRLILGGEWVGYHRVRANFEVGYVFNRRLKYRSGTPTAEPNDTVMLRGGLAF